MKVTESEINRHLGIACNIAATLIEKRARAILRRHSNLHEFVMACGVATFTTKSGIMINVISAGCPKYMDSFGKFVSRCNGYLRMCGNPMRFTVKGKKITTW